MQEVGLELSRLLVTWTRIRQRDQGGEATLQVLNQWVGPTFDRLEPGADFSNYLYLDCTFSSLGFPLDISYGSRGLR